MMFFVKQFSSQNKTQGINRQLFYDDKLSKKNISKGGEDQEIQRIVQFSQGVFRNGRLGASNPL